MKDDNGAQNYRRTFGTGKVKWHLTWDLKQINRNSENKETPASIAQFMKHLTEKSRARASWLWTQLDDEVPSCHTSALSCSGSLPVTVRRWWPGVPGVHLCTSRKEVFPGSSPSLRLGSRWLHSSYAYHWPRRSGIVILLGWSWSWTVSSSRKIRILLSFKGPVVVHKHQASRADGWEGVS